MSGDVQPRKRKEKRRKKDSEEIPSNFSNDEQLHVHKDASTGGNICAKILFFLLSFVLLVMIGLVVFEYRGTADDEALVPVSKWASTFDGWLETPVKHDEHADVTESGEQEHGDSGEHENESAEEEEHLSEEATSKEDEEEEEEEEEPKESEEEETKSAEEEDEDEESDKLEDEGSEEVDENEVEEMEDREDDDEDEEQEEESEEDVYEHRKSEEDVEGEEDGTEEEEDEEENAESGREELDDDEEEERQVPAYGHESDEIDDLLSEIPGITESDEDEEGDNLGRSDEIIDKLQKIPGVQEKKIKGVSEEDDDHPRRKQEKEVGGEIKNSKTTQDKTVVEEEEDDNEPEPSGVPKTKKLQREEDDESGSEKEVPVTKSKIPKNMGGQNAQVYSKADTTNEDDWHIIQDLDRADDDAEENPEVAIHRYDTILKSHPNSPRAWYGKATALDQLAAKKKSNLILDQAIDAYKKVISGLTNVPDKLFSLAAERCIDRMRFRGTHARAVPIHKLLIARFPDNPAYQNQLAVTHLMINRSPEAKQVLENVLQKWPNNGFAQVHYGFILKTGNYNMTEAVRYLQEGIATREPGTIDGRFFFQLGDALMRLGRRKEAMEINELGVREGLFLSKYQRSLYNVDRLRAQPWWTPEETTYAPYFRKLQENWKQIQDEGVKALYDKNRNLFRDEAENLKDSGKWKQLELFARGRKVPANCAKVPVTCKLIEEFPAARDCRRGQVKFSVMDPGTHVWPHCGPTNCRLRAHLGLVVPKNTFIRVAEETRTWEEGKLFIFDDSFEHEVWHNGTATRLVLIVDVWHPELTMEEKHTLPAI